MIIDVTTQTAIQVGTDRWTGVENLPGSRGDDTFIGGPGDDNFLGEDGADTVSGGGNDVLTVDAGTVDAGAGAGDDLVLIRRRSHPLQG